MKATRSKSEQNNDDTESSLLYMLVAVTLDVERTVSRLFPYALG